MARQEKYYSTLTIVQGDKLNKLKELGYYGTHNQFSIICKAKSMAEASRIADDYGLGSKCFTSRNTIITKNDSLIEMVEKYGFIIQVGGFTGRYISIKEIV